MPEIPDVIGGDLITATYNNQVRDRAVMRYSNAAARDSSVPIPVAGDLAWLNDIEGVTVYNGTVWQPVGVPVDFDTVGPNDIAITSLPGDTQAVYLRDVTVMTQATFLVTATAYFDVTSQTTLPRTVFTFRIRTNTPTTLLAEVLTRPSENDALLPVSVSAITPVSSAGGIDLTVVRSSAEGGVVLRGATLNIARVG